jgi:hypothetical protein
VAEGIRCERIAQGLDDGILTEQLGETLRSPGTGEDLVAHRVMVPDHDHREVEIGRSAPSAATSSATASIFVSMRPKPRIYEI